MKNQTINFRVDESTKLLLKDFSQEFNLKESEFIRKAIVSFKELNAQVQAAAPDKERIQELEAQLKELRFLLETHEKNEAFTALFKKIKGHTIERKKIKILNGKNLGVMNISSGLAVLQMHRAESFSSVSTTKAKFRGLLI